MHYRSTSVNTEISVNILNMKPKSLLSFVLTNTFFASVILSSTSFGQQPAAINARTGSTLSELQNGIRLKLSSPSVRRGNIGLKIVSLNSGKVLIEENAEKYFMPASNMKNYTVATALEKLTPDFRFVTTAWAATKPESDGSIKGDLYIRGVGDVSISHSFNNEDRFKGIDRFVDALINAGVKKIDGGIVGDDSYFTGSPIPSGWELDDLQWYYGAEVSSLPINDNAVSLSIVPSTVGSQCAAKILPFNFVYQVNNRCVTTAAGTQRTLRVEKKVGENLIELSGNLPVGNAGFSNNVTVSRPANMFASMLKQRLQEKGVTVKGAGRAIPNGSQTSAVAQIEIARIESPPLGLIAAKTMKPSQNMYTEVLLRTLGEQARKTILNRPMTNVIQSGSDFTRDSAVLGIDAVKKFMMEIGVAEDAVLQYDGSGLSRHNLITPSSVIQLYSYMGTQSRFAQVWRDSLTVGGVDGTLRNRFKGTRGEANFRGKTGTIDQVSALSGYLTTAGGEQLVFSMIVNGVGETRTRVGLIDEIVVMLANFDGKIESN
mgnify:CR=1 FL=1